MQRARRSGPGVQDRAEEDLAARRAAHGERRRAAAAPGGLRDAPHPAHGWEADHHAKRGHLGGTHESWRSPPPAAAPPPPPLRRRLPPLPLPPPPPLRRCRCLPPPPPPPSPRAAVAAGSAPDDLKIKIAYISERVSWVGPRVVGRAVLPGGPQSVPPRKGCSCPVERRAIGEAMHANGRSGARQSQRSRSTKTCRRPEISSHFRVRSSKRTRLFAPPLPAQSCRRAQEAFPHSAALTAPFWPQPRPREDLTRPREEHGLSGAHSLDQHVPPADGRGRTTIFAAASEWGSYAEVQHTHSRAFLRAC